MNYYFMGHNFTSTQLNVAEVGFAVVILVAVSAFIERRKSRTLAFRNRFGTEYDGALLRHGSARKAESNLADMKARAEAPAISELSVTERDLFLIEWHAVQCRFVDHPRAAVSEADDLIDVLIEACGNPPASFEPRAADVSVHHHCVMENYRIAHSVAVRPGQLEATTEELRTAMIQYRDIFNELVREPESIATEYAA